MDKYFKKENVYPNEALVQEAIELYFSGKGYVIKTKEQVDLIAEKQDEKWIIKAKGMTSAVGTDFNTCLGQLIKNMTSEEQIYAIAIPSHLQYRRQCELLPSYFRELVKLRILLIDESGEVCVIEPHESIEKYFIEKIKNKVL